MSVYSTGLTSKIGIEYMDFQRQNVFNIQKHIRPMHMYSCKRHKLLSIGKRIEIKALLR